MDGILGFMFVALAVGFVCMAAWASSVNSQLQDLKKKHNLLVKSMETLIEKRVDEKLTAWMAKAKANFGEMVDELSQKMK